MKVLLHKDVTFSPERKQDWLQLRAALWPNDDPAELQAEIDSILKDPGYTVFFVASPDGALDGFMELRVRPFVNGARKEPVLHIEGWYLRQERRGHGAGKALLAAAQDWALKNGFDEITSDAHINNASSVSIHERTGFTETERVIYFRKTLK